MYAVRLPVVDVSSKIRRIFEIVFFVFVIALSIMIYLMRDRIEHIGDIGYVGLFLLCFLANSTVLLPSPSLMIAASCALIMNPWLVALFAALGSSLGELVGYAFGSVSKELSPRFRKIIGKLTEKIHNQTLLVFVLAALPLPLFDVVGIYSGGAKMNLVKFYAACLAGKFVKMLVYTRMYDILAWSQTMMGLE